MEPPDRRTFYLSWVAGRHQLHTVRFCPLCSTLHYGPYGGEGALGWCSCDHVLVPLPLSPERMSAFHLGGPSAVEVMKGCPSDEQFRHPGGWFLCTCADCKAQRQRFFKGP